MCQQCSVANKHQRVHNNLHSTLTILQSAARLRQSSLSFLHFGSVPTLQNGTMKLPIECWCCCGPAFWWLHFVLKEFLHGNFPNCWGVELEYYKPASRTNPGHHLYRFHACGFVHGLSLAQKHCQSRRMLAQTIAHLSGKQTVRFCWREGPAACGTICDIGLCVTCMIQERNIKKRPFRRKYFPSKPVVGTPNVP